MSDSLPNDARADKQSRSATDRAFVVALGKGLRILEAFTPELRWLGNAEISELAGIPKPTVSRFTKVLTAEGYLHYAPGRRQYCLGTSVLALGYAGRAGTSLTEVIHPYLQRLADDFGIHAALVGRDRTNVIHLDVCRSANKLTTLQLDIGSRIPLAGTASGHALLSRILPEERAALLAQLAVRHEKRWDRIEEQIQAGLREVEDWGYASSVHGWQTDINGVAVPIVAMGETPVLAISCGWPSRYLPPGQMQVIGERMVADAARIMELHTQKRSEREVAGK